MLTSEDKLRIRRRAYELSAALERAKREKLAQVMGHDLVSWIIQEIEEAVAIEREQITKENAVKKAAESHKTQSGHRVVVVPFHEGIFFCDAGDKCEHGGQTVNTEGTEGREIIET